MNWFLATMGISNMGHISRLSRLFYADWLIFWPKAMPRQLSFFSNRHFLFKSFKSECYA